jgi:hypothetical protein
VRKKGFRDRQATETEIAESVVERLMKWARWAGGILAIAGAITVFALHSIYGDLRDAIGTAKTQIQSTVGEGKTNISTTIAEATREIAVVRHTTDDLREQASGLQADIKHFKEVNAEMETLRKQLHGQTEDLSKVDLRVRSLETVGSPSDADEPSGVALKSLGCQPSKWTVGAKVVLCSQGSPPLFYQRAGNEIRPISSFSPIGFRDESVGPKPACTAAIRGTFYVEKGAGKEADKPLLCARKSDSTYAWIQLGTP